MVCLITFEAESGAALRQQLLDFLELVPRGASPQADAERHPRREAPAEEEDALTKLINQPVDQPVKKPRAPRGASPREASLQADARGVTPQAAKDTIAELRNIEEESDMRISAATPTQPPAPFKFPPIPDDMPPSDNMEADAVFTDAVLSAACSKKASEGYAAGNADTNNLIRALVTKYGTSGQGISGIPQTNRAAFLDAINALSF